MKLGFLLGRREFSSESEIINSIKDFERFQPDELLNKVSTLLIFKSEIQQCWLVFTSQRMYFVIDDIDKDIIKTLWARDKENLIVDGKIALHLKEENHSRESGKLYFGKMNNGILFTKSLFRNKSISGTILSLLGKHILT
ncbi:TPA: hypothetical protein R6W42_001709 [Citrobacter freundii]|uniref:hypothetical protein n=1 Tax=Enterobacteriaceae TaxID=543 RepID=UPI000D385C00|nr:MULTISPECIES: hypothetical protein [Enterobacteriaceae]MBJ9311335.1 hypothetical protein [Citrobacter freundii]RAU49097.1 hypothetical protein DBY68_011020 [Pseudocitrobacter sp. RIT 415]HEE0086715.1 hypothetical protein [Citrobacter freundii]HEI8940832.1 hypothetical protein [Citrobacter freundii]HEJ0167493.1 hypothetical protein [Citrobacter freundii]